MTFREFSGKNVEEAIRAAMKEFSADLSEMDIEILSQGSRGILGVGRRRGPHPGRSQVRGRRGRHRTGRRRGARQGSTIPGAAGVRPEGGGAPGPGADARRGLARSGSDGGRNRGR